MIEYKISQKGWTKSVALDYCSLSAFHFFFTFTPFT